MRQPKKWYRLALSVVFCATYVLCVKLKAPVEAYLPLGLMGCVSLGASLAKLWPTGGSK